ncbi:hypothetical protein SAMN05660199_03160 [Klenkia soli]|uniref:Uncharacterized protein n=1 Tax=Klenkia soli TaxID=1052260 RepID=A0A1H0PZA8_9ACTN|nr:hypothetical protein [Klenkia soli]SDP10443.1 hypothetical protein SAMN05660199_03160 [Klenkia soli]
MPNPTPAGPESRSAPARVLGAVGVVGMASPLIWVVVLAALWLVARDRLNGGLVFYVFGSTLLAMVVGVLLFAWADRLDQRRRPHGDGTTPEP